MLKPLSYRNICSADTGFQQSQLVNRLFEDIYHHRDAIAESRYVFHEGNDLVRQWHNCASKESFVIAETGFGSGLNFLTTRRLWQSTDKKPKRLHFISTEQWLLTPEQLNQAYTDIPELHADLAAIRPVFSKRRAGFHTFHTDADITLTLLLGDATACFRQLKATVDAWFLDGFSPAKNPDMWSTELMTAMARLSRPGTTFATFTAASKVRKNLLSAGFAVSKTPGFQGKRERLIGHFSENPTPIQEQKSWAAVPRAKPTPRHIAIIGGGVAGLCLAHRAGQSGLRVTVIDRHPQPLGGASGNPYAMMMPYLTARSSPEALFYWRAFDYAKNFYPDSVFHAIGVQTDGRMGDRDVRKTLDHELIHNNDAGICYPGSGYIDTAALASHLLPAVNDWITAAVGDIKCTDQGRWHVQNTDLKTICDSDVLVVAAGIQSIQLLPDLQPFVTARGGQTELYQLSDWPAPLHSIQHNKHYVIPIKHQKQILIGGDYHHLPSADWFNTLGQRPKTPQLNYQAWQQQSNRFLFDHAQLLQTRMGIRAGTTDHLPLCGPVVNSAQFKLDYADLHHGRHWQSYPPAAVHKNLYLLSGLGSRGYTSAPLLADYLMAMILNQPLPLEHDLFKIVHPGRFYYRQLKKPPQPASGD